MVSIPAGATETITSSLWTGPKLQNKMAEVANHLDLTVDYGWAWFIAKPLFWLLTFIQSIVSNWGVAIICVTLVVKAILYPLTKSTIHFYGENAYVATKNARNARTFW